MAEAGFVPPPGSYVWGSLMVATGKAGDGAGVLALWSAATRELQNGYNPDGSRDAGTAAAARGAHSSRPDVEGPKPEHKPNAKHGPKAKPSAGLLAACIHALNCCGEVHVALDVFHAECPAVVAPSTRLLNIAISSHHPSSPEVPSRACAAAAVLLFRRGLRDWQLQPDIVTYSALLVLCARRGDANLATMLFSDMNRRGIKEDRETCVLLMTTLGAAGRVDDVAKVWARMVWGKHRVRPKRHTFLAVAAIFRQAGDLPRALHAYMGMRKSGLKPCNQEFGALMVAATEAALQGSSAPLFTRASSSSFRCRVPSLADVVPADVAGRSSGAAILDLHGLSAGEARAAVLSHLSSLQEEYSRSGSVSQDLILITGAGSHSLGGATPLRDSVRRLLISLSLLFTSSEATASNTTVHADASSVDQRVNGFGLGSMNDSSGDVDKAVERSSQSHKGSGGTTANRLTFSKSLGRFKPASPLDTRPTTPAAPTIVDTGLSSRREAAWLAVEGSPSTTWSATNAAALTKAIILEWSDERSHSRLVDHQQQHQRRQYQHRSDRQFNPSASSANDHTIAESPLVSTAVSAHDIGTYWMDRMLQGGVEANMSTSDSAATSKAAIIAANKTCNDGETLSATGKGNLGRLRVSKVALEQWVRRRIYR